MNVYGPATGGSSYLRGNTPLSRAE